MNQPRLVLATVAKTFNGLFASADESRMREFFVKGHEDRTVEIPYLGTPQREHEWETCLAGFDNTFVTIARLPKQ
jgi:hypothetical protein